MKAGIVENVKDYEYSSWGEYAGTIEFAFQICDTATVFLRMPFEELEAWVNESLPDDVGCLELEESESFRQFTDDRVWRYIEEMTGATNDAAFQQLNKEKQNIAIVELRTVGASVRQIERLTGIGRGIFLRMKM